MFRFFGHRDLAVYMDREYLGVAKRLTNPYEYPILGESFVHVISSDPKTFQKDVSLELLQAGTEGLSPMSKVGRNYYHAFPLHDFSGKRVGVIVTGKDMSLLAGRFTTIRIGVVLGSIAVLIILSLIMTLITRRVARPLAAISRKLASVGSNTEELEEGQAYKQLTKQIELVEFDERVATRELQILNSSFKEMKSNLLSTHERLEGIHAANSRFVPREFLDHLNRESVLDVRLGDHVESRMSVLFTDLRSFTSISETMTPEENFEFINGYLGKVAPIVRDHHGFIDKYIGDAIMALFDRCPDDALTASVEMLRALNAYNRSLAASESQQIRMGVGIHIGNLMLGTVGESNRMETTVISDVVNTASRLESLSKTLRGGCPDQRGRPERIERSGRFCDTKDRPRETQGKKGSGRHLRGVQRSFSARVRQEAVNEERV